MILPLARTGRVGHGQPSPKAGCGVNEVRAAPSPVTFDKKGHSDANEPCEIPARREDE